MKITASPISGVFVLKSNPVSDNRGSFARMFCSEELSEILGTRQIAQINLSKTTSPGTVRGMHCQMPPRAEMKMVSCVKGRVWDVAVDLRSESKTFLQWFAQELSPDNLETMVIPEGCAHGFQSLEPVCELLYLHTAHYDPRSEKGFLPTDPQLNIRWPLPITMLSDRDRNHPPLQADFGGIRL